MCRIVLGFALCVLSLAQCFAQMTDAQIAASRAVLERQQQSEEFSLQLQQSQRRLQLPPRGPERAAVDAADLEQILEQQQLHDSQQLRSTLPGASASVFELERRAGALTPNGIPVWGPTLAPARRWTPTAEKPRPAWTPTMDGR
jgi:hypothetical protein